MSPAPHDAHKIPNVLVPYDFSPAADCALDWAAAHCKALGAGTVRILHVINPVPTTFAPIPAPPAIPGEVIQDAERLMRERAAGLGVPASSEVLLSPASVDVILDAARQWPADLIVMGTHGRSGVSRLVLGSVAELVVRHAPCPVVTLHGPSAPARRPG